MAKARTAKRVTRPTQRRVKRILNCLESPGRDQDWPAEQAYQARGMAAAPALPASKDLREGWWKIGNQGSTGSCVGWATADSVLRWHFAKAGIVKPDERLSVRYMWMAAKETDEFTRRPTTFIESDGTSLKSALDIARRYGVVLDKELPFATGALYAGEASTFYAIASLRRIASYFSLPTQKPAAVSSWRKWLATAGPILTRLDVDDTWMDLGTTGVLAKYKANTKQGGHAVAVVGYTPNQFIIRNSWGTSWGDRGFAYATLP
ncbi:MAG TPA: C1 family peptidase, partial [Longimicrobiales bacterium]|nr:C1 family peptidase [Longimicrobiales bacterium]